MDIAPFSRLADLLPEAMLLVAGKGTVLAANRAVAEPFGLAPSQLVGRNLAEFVADPPGLASYLHACSRTREMLLGSLVLRSPGGEQRPCRCEGAVLQPRAGETDAVLLLRLVARDAAVARFTMLTEQLEEMAREVHRRQRSEEELRQQREWLQVTLASIGDAVIATDTAGQVTFMNPVAESLTAWQQEEARSRPLESVFTILHSETRQPAENPVLTVLRRGRAVPLSNHTVLVARDGIERAIDDCAAPIVDSNGRLIGIVLVFHDVTDRRRLERELTQRAERLAEADRRKDEFLAMLAHELRNPLAPILNGLHILRLADARDPSREPTLQMMERQIRHLSRLVDAFLEVSRLTRGQIRLERVRLDLAALVRTTVEDRRGLLTGAGLSVTVDVPARPVWVMGDGLRLAQVLSNLLDNAAKFTDAGGRVSVRLSIDLPREQALLRVQDTGIGIEPEMLPRLFEPFSQADRSLDRTRGGLGLGLTLVRGLVQLHGGEVQASSAGQGTGTEFLVRLPLHGDGTTGIAPPAAPASPRQSLRILIIEDNPDVSASLRLVLQIAGHQVEVASSGPAGVERATEWRPDVVLCDIGLPGLDGFEVARRLRRHPATANVRLLAVTGYGTDADRRRSQEAGFDHHLIKPVDPALLLSLLLKARTEESPED